MSNKPFLAKNGSFPVGHLHYYHTDHYDSMTHLHKSTEMNGVKRVLVFCVLIVIIPTSLIIIPLYLRKTVYADVVYPVAESDIIEIRDGISSIFCAEHTLRMNSTFNAFQLRSRPEISTNRKHIRLKKSMTLPDDTLEYWGFYLLKGAKVHLKFCSRYDGSRILVVKGQRELNLCGLLDHNKNKWDANLAQGHEQVKVFFEDMREIAANVPTDELENPLGDDNMENENHGGEQLNDDEPETNATTTTTTTTSTTARPVKKLKKGTIRRPSAVLNATAAAEREHERRRRSVHELLFRRRTKRDHIIDRKYSHGGNAVNFTETDESNSISSFENGLFQCFDGAVLHAKGFPPSPDCHSAHFLENGSQRMLSKHEITEDGYYYYIFYSDNDLVRNDIHAIFDIYKPTYQYSNLSNSQGCVNVTNCTFPISFLSDEIVIVEVPTRDGIEHEEDDITRLISTCHPRTEVYALFPVTVLLLILCCAFM